MATLKTIINPQFSQKTYSVHMERNYKYESISSTYALNILNIKTTTKSFAISQTLYIYQIFLESNKV